MLGFHLGFYLFVFLIVCLFVCLGRHDMSGPVPDAKSQRLVWSPSAAQGSGIFSCAARSRLDGSWVRSENAPVLSLSRKYMLSPIHTTLSVVLPCSLVTLIVIHRKIPRWKLLVCMHQEMTDCLWSSLISRKATHWKVSEDSLHKPSNAKSRKKSWVVKFSFLAWSLVATQRKRKRERQRL